VNPSKTPADSSGSQPSITLDHPENRRWPLSRRTVLRGLGTALALPWLEAMVPNRRSLLASDAAVAGDAPVRLAALFVPNGVRSDHWTPDGEGRDFKLSPTLEPLSEYQRDILVLTNLWNQASDVGDGHYVKTSGFLTCTTINKSLGIDLNCNGISMDQVAAQSVAGKTPFPSLELAIDPVSVGVDTNVGYTRVYGSHIAWNGPTNPLAREINPRFVYQRLLRATSGTQAAGRRQALLLDRVLDDAKQLQQRLGASDRQRMDEYLQSVRSIESRLEQQERKGEHVWQPRLRLNEAETPPELRYEHAEHVQVMLDMIALAFQTDSTRVCTFMFGNAVSGQNFSFLDGVSGGHHDISHHQNEEDKLAMYQRINHWHVEQYAYLLSKLRAMQEGERTVLDNSIILYGSGLRDGNSHNPHNLPIIVGGRAGGRLDTGKHLAFGKDTPLANLYVNLLNAFGCETASFADSSGPLSGVSA
jgi:hypothetical protein